MRRLRAAGAIVVGKTHMPEFGAYPYTESDAYGYTRNPWNTDVQPGGSSGGTAAAVVSGMVPIGMGGDGGGSIRVPASYCGLFGLKPHGAGSPPLPWSTCGGRSAPSAPCPGPCATPRSSTTSSAAPLPGDRWRAGEVGSFTEAGPPASRAGCGSAGAPSRSPRGSVRTRNNVAAVRETARVLADLGHDIGEIKPGYPDPSLAFVPQFFAGIRTEADAMEHYGRLEPPDPGDLPARLVGRPEGHRVRPQQTEKVSLKANRVFDPPGRRAARPP